MHLASIYLLGSFLSGAGAFAAVAAGAVAIPVIVHLLNRNRYRVVNWAAMRFLLAAHRKTYRRVRLERLLLLAVRILILMTLISAMASVMPWAQAVWSRWLPSQAAGAIPSQARTHKILVLDGSMSMALRVGGRTCFERAQESALRLVRDSAGGDGFSIVLMARPPRVIVSQASEDSARVADEIRSLRLPHGNADVAASCSVIDDLLEHSPDKFTAHEVYFFTDLQRATWIDRRRPDSAAILQKIQARARIAVVDLGQEGVTNLAVTALTLGVSVASTHGPTPISVTVRNYGAEKREKVPLELWLGKARAAPGDPPLGLRLVGEEVIDLLPGQTLTRTIPYHFTRPGDYALQARIGHDALEIDDSRAAVVSVKDTIPVLLVNGKPAVEVFDRATEWLRDALNPFEKGTVPDYVAARPKVISLAEFADAGAGDLSRYDCVYLCDVPRLTQGEIRRLEQHLHTGGGLVICLGPRVDTEEYNRLLYRNAEGISPVRLAAHQRAPENRFFTLFSDDENYRFPPLDAFAADNDRMSLTSVHFREYTRLELPSRGRGSKILSFQPSPLFSPQRPLANSADALQPADASLPAGDPALVVDKRFRGRVAVLATTVNMDWNTWPISPSFPAFMQELLRYSVSGRLREKATEVGEPLEESFPEGTADLEAVVNTPDGRTETVRTETQGGSVLLRWADTDTSGIYRIDFGGRGREHLFAVNPPAASASQETSESDLARTGKEELESAYPGWDCQIVSDPAQLVTFRAPFHARRERGRTEDAATRVARGLLLTMIGLLLIETVLAARPGRGGAPDENSVTPSLALRATMGKPPGSWLPVFIGVFTVSAGLVVGGTLLHAVLTGDFLGFLPGRLHGWLESQLAISPAGEGEQTRWRLEFLPYLRGRLGNPWVAGVLALAFLGFVILVYYRERGRLTRSSRLALSGLRVGTLLLAFVVLLPQLRIIFERQSWPDVAIIIDDSRSMSTVDNYQDDNSRRAAERLAKTLHVPLATRLQLVQAALTQGEPNLVESLLEDQVKVHVYHCSAQAVRLADLAGSQAPLPPVLDAVKALAAEGESSRLGETVRRVIDDFRGTSLSAIVMLTDGVTTEGEDLEHAARYAAKSGVPLYLVGVGEAREPRDLKLQDLQVEDSVYVNDRLVFEAKVVGRGFPNLTVPVLLREKGKPRVLASQRVHVPPDGKPVRVRLTHQPTEPGEKAYVLEIPEQPGQPHPAPFNRLERAVTVRESRTVRVLYVEGEARYEFRFVKNLLERENPADPRNKSIDLRVLLLDADSEYPKLDRSAVSEFPTPAELSQFDVVIFGDVNPKDPRIEKHLTEIADFVRERGGGFLMIAGERFSPEAYKDTALADILPVEVAGAQPSENAFTLGYRPALTGTGRFHPIFRFSPDETENNDIWNQLPEMYWWSTGYVAKPGAEVLATHPTQSAGTGGSAAVSGHHPLVLQQFVGAGRSLFLGFDETWRWRYRDNERHFNQFWIQTVRHLARNRSGRIELRLDRQSPYRRGEPIRVLVRFPDDMAVPGPDLEVKVGVERRYSPADADIESRTLNLSRIQGSRASYEGILTQTPEGSYRFWLSSPAAPQGRPQAECTVLPPPGEMDRLEMNQQEMERAAEVSKGRFYTLADVDQVLADLPLASRVTYSSPQPPFLLWNHGVVFALALAFLTLEWLARKRFNLV